MSQISTDDIVKRNQEDDSRREPGSDDVIPADKIRDIEENTRGNRGIGNAFETGASEKSETEKNLEDGD